MKKNFLITKIAKILYRRKLNLLKSKITPKKFNKYSADIKINKYNTKLQSEKIEHILDKYKSEPKKLIEYIKGAKTPVYILKNPNMILSKINEKEGFILPSKGLKAVYLNLILERKISFKTSEMFVISNNFSSYLFVYEFYKWYCYKTGAQGYDLKTQNKYKNIFKYTQNYDNDLTFDEIIDLKAAIKRDIEAIEFVKNYSIKHSKSKEVFKKLLKKQSSAI